jgi:hypothetical protein
MHMVAVMLRESGASSTPRPRDSVAGVAGILDRPFSRAMTPVVNLRPTAFVRKITELKELLLAQEHNQESVARIAPMTKE